MVSHQANRRIILSAAERLELPVEKVVINIANYGNTTAAPSRWPSTTRSRMDG